MSKYQLEKPVELEDLEAARWVQEATAGVAREAQNLDPRLPATKQFHVRANPYELELLQRLADMGMESKQRVARRALRDYCERKLKAAGVKLP